MKKKPKPRQKKREAQKALAKEITIFVHGDVAFKNAENISENLFSGKIKDLNEQDLEQIFSDSSVKKLEKVEGLNIVDLLVLSDTVSSKRQAREDIQNGAIELNGEKNQRFKLHHRQKDLLFGKYIIAKRGKRVYKFIEIR